jgi:hypothetical protein
MEELTLRNFEAYITRVPHNTLTELKNTLERETVRRQTRKYIDSKKLKNEIKRLYPFIYDDLRTNNKVSYRMAISILLHEFSDKYHNLNKKEISKIIERDRATVYHYIGLKDRLHLAGYEFNAEAFEDVKKEFLSRIKSGEFDKHL